MIRLILILLVVFLIVRIFIGLGATTDDNKKPESPGGNTKAKSGVPKGIGEYVDFEEVKKKGN